MIKKTKSSFHYLFHIYAHALTPAFAIRVAGKQSPFPATDVNLRVLVLGAMDVKLTVDVKKTVDVEMKVRKFLDSLSGP